MATRRQPLLLSSSALVMALMAALAVLLLTAPEPANAGDERCMRALRSCVQGGRGGECVGGGCVFVMRGACVGSALKGSE